MAFIRQKPRAETLRYLRASDRALFDALSMLLRLRELAERDSAIREGAFARLHEVCNAVDDASKDVMLMRSDAGREA
jgi:hypothetical protein